MSRPAVLGYAAPPAWREQLDGGRWIGLSDRLRARPRRGSASPAIRTSSRQPDYAASTVNPTRAPPPGRSAIPRAAAVCDGDARDQREPEAEAARRTRHEGANASARRSAGSRATIVDLDRDSDRRDARCESRFAPLPCTRALSRRFATARRTSVGSTAARTSPCASTRSTSTPAECAASATSSPRSVSRRSDCRTRAATTRAACRPARRAR